MTISFGKYKGKNLEDIPSDYLKWIINKCKCSDELIEACEEEYEFRNNWNKHFYE